jgi:hypothetical protein
VEETSTRHTSARRVSVQNRRPDVYRYRDVRRPYPPDHTRRSTVRRRQPPGRLPILQRHESERRSSTPVPCMVTRKTRPVFSREAFSTPTQSPWIYIQSSERSPADYDETETNSNESQEIRADRGESWRIGAFFVRPKRGRARDDDRRARKFGPARTDRRGPSADRPISRVSCRLEPGESALMASVSGRGERASHRGRISR